MEKDEKINLLKELRKEEGLNRKEFALEYNIPYPTITDWEMGHRRIPEYFLKLLAYKVRLGTEENANFSDELAKQLAFDYCCTPEDVCDKQNHFTIFSANDNQRITDDSDNPALRIAVVNGKLLFTGEEAVIRCCEKEYKDTQGAWFMDARNFRFLEELLDGYGHRIKTVHNYYIPADKNVFEPGINDFELVKYSYDEIEQLRGDDRYKEAFYFGGKASDMLGIAAVKDKTIIGMAGACADSPIFWQIRINIIPQKEQDHISEALVLKLKQEIIARCKVPFYGTSISDIAFQMAALNSGFRPAWVELVSERNH